MGEGKAVLVEASLPSDFESISLITLNKLVRGLTVEWILYSSGVKYEKEVIGYLSGFIWNIPL